MVQCTLERTYYIETFGCQMNERDSQTIAGLLEDYGFSRAEGVETADVIVVNTCAVRQSAENKVWSRLGKIASLRKGGKQPVMVLAGCMAQLPQTVKRVKSRFPYIHAVVGPGHIHRIPELVHGFMEGQGKAAEHPAEAVSPRRTGAGKDESAQMLPEGLPRVKVPGLSAFVNIMFGCDNFCSYCIVPFVRGPQISRQPDAVKSEVVDLVRDGYREITLLGQNVNAYGLDLDGEYGFADLLSELDRTPGLLRLRYFTSHPRDFTKEMVDVIARSRTVCEHFHLPLQSGSNRILRAMNRGYTSEDYLALVDYIRDKLPGASLTTDIIAGFPGETGEDFQDTVDMVRSVRFDGAFTFIFSPRKGTSAARSKDQIPPAEKSERLQRLVELQSGITREKNRKLLGQVVEVLLEDHAEDPKHTLKGRTRTNKVVFAGAGDAEPGDLANVKIQETGTWYLKGQVVT